VQALIGVQPHACCLRRLHAHADHEQTFSRSQSPAGNCCPPLTAPNSAVLAGPEASSLFEFSARAAIADNVSRHSAFAALGFSDRAPPHSYASH
jgi:hypothetical protein